MSTTQSQTHRKPYRRPRVAPASVRVYRQTDRWARPETLRLRVLRITAALVVLDHEDGPAQFDRATGWGCRAARGGAGAGAHGRDWSAWRIAPADWSRIYTETDSATRRDYRSPDAASPDATSRES